MKMISVKKNIEIKYAKNRMPLIRGDYDRLRQLLIIFIDNAIKFTPQNGVISIATTVVDSMACIKIRDTGKGIAKEDIPFIFERFYKADKSRGGSSKGTGLGLSIANTIAELHGGGITVESEIGKGTEFSIMLPLAENSKD